MTSKTPLFLDELPLVDIKTAAMTMLAEDPEVWPMQIQDLLYKQAPYLSKYNVQIQMDKMDPIGGYGLGNAIVRAATNPEAGQSPAPAEVIVPIIIKERKIYPLDVFIANGRTLPLSEDKINTALFRPDVYAVSRRRADRYDLMNQFFTPSTYSGAYEYVKTSGGILGNILPWSTKEDRDAVVEAARGDETVKQAAMAHPSFGLLLGKIAAAKDSGWEEAVRKTAADQFNQPQVFQVVKEARNQYLARWGGQEAYPGQERLTTEQLTARLPADLVDAVEKRGSVTLVIGAKEQPQRESRNVVDADQPGAWSFKTAGGFQEGLLFPEVFNMAGQKVPVRAMVNDEGYVLQDKIAAWKVADVDYSTLPEDEPKPGDHGVFYRVKAGSAQCTVPVTIQSDYADHSSGSFGYFFESFDGAKGRTVKVASDMAFGGSGKNCFLPSDFKFKKIGSASMVADDDMNSVAGAYQPQGDILIRQALDDRFNVLGLDTVMKTAGVDRDEALFVLGAAGVDPKDAEVSLNKAGLVGVDRLQSGRKLASAQDMELKLVKLAGSRPSVAGIKKLLVKEAAIIASGLEKRADDSSAATVDSMLSLGLVNPDNLAAFRQYIPALEDTESKLSELLLATRMGDMQEIPDVTIENALRYLEEAIVGIRQATQGVNFASTRS